MDKKGHGEGKKEHYLGVQHPTTELSHYLFMQTASYGNV